MTNVIHPLEEYEELDNPSRVATASGEEISVFGKGWIRTDVFDIEVHYVPELSGSLLSMTKLADAGARVSISKGIKKISDSVD
jgi:hypothetical protein